MGRRIVNFILIFFGIYFFLYTFPFPFYYLPFGIGQKLSSIVNDFWSNIVFYFSDSFLGNPIEKVRNGSGDTSYDYAEFYIQLSISFLISILIIYFGRIRFFLVKNRMYFFYYLRFYLGFILMGYALSKVFYLQFWEPTLSDLIKPYGESSRMGVLWRFMGLSEGYSIFAGLLQFFSGFLLLFERTYKIGVVGSFGVLLNIVALNIFFDVPVKLFSLHLLIASLILIIKDYKSYISFFFSKPDSKAKFKKKIYRNSFLTLKTILILYFLFSGIDGRIKRQKRFGKRAPSHALYGVYYKVEDSAKLVDTTSNHHDTLTWKTMIMDKNSTILIKENDDRIFANHKIDTIQNKLILTGKKQDFEFDFSYTITDSTLFLSKITTQDSLKLFFKRMKREDFPLMNFETNWINEFPNNR
ncbi:MAG: hypothetical protein VX798_03010 [Bacteroidota bacterium]|nr:hypothetical protein [Bacteroidota bacterium]